MKQFFTLCCFLLTISTFAQTRPYGLMEVGNTYEFVSIDPVTGTTTTINTVPGMTAFVAGDKTVIDPVNGWYVFVGFINNTFMLVSLDLQTGSIVNAYSYQTNVVGFEYNCEDSLIYGLWEDNNQYHLVTVNPATGQNTFIDNIPTISAYGGGSFALDAKRGLYTFTGLNGVQLLLYAININDATIVYNNLFTDNVAGRQFNCPDSTIYGLYEDGQDYKIESVDPATGTHTTVGVLPGVSPGLISESITINAEGEYIYRGFIGADFVLFTIDPRTATIIHSPIFTDNVVGIEADACCIPVITDVPTLEKAAEVSIVPNPVSSLAEVRWQNSESATFTIYDATGRVVWSKTAVQRVLFDRSDLPSGMYYYTLTTTARPLANGKLVLQ